MFPSFWGYNETHGLKIQSRSEWNVRGAAQDLIARHRDAYTHIHTCIHSPWIASRWPCSLFLRRLDQLLGQKPRDTHTVTPDTISGLFSACDATDRLGRYTLSLFGWLLLFFPFGRSRDLLDGTHARTHSNTARAPSHIRVLVRRSSALAAQSMARMCLS